MKKILLFSILILNACTSIVVPNEFRYEEIQTSTFKIAVWQKISEHNAPFKIYIEGDGYAFSPQGAVSRNPTPRGTLVRELAFGDKHTNVVYMARPCQFVTDDELCQPIYWSTARFSQEAVAAEYETIKKIADNQPITLVGFSGGAQIAGLIAVKYNLNIKKLVTIAGNLDVIAWTEYHNLPQLTLSDDLHNYQEEYAKYPQVHYVGMKDDNIIASITEKFVRNSQNIKKIQNASHNSGWQSVYEQIRSE